MKRKLKIYQVGSPKNFIKTVRILVLRRTYLDIYKLKIHFWFFREPLQNSVTKYWFFEDQCRFFNHEWFFKVPSVIRVYTYTILQHVIPMSHARVASLVRNLAR